MVRIKRQIKFDDLTGGLNNVDSIDRINSSPRNTESPDLSNVEFSGLGGIKPMEGNTQIGQKFDTKVIGGWDYQKGNNRYMIIALDNGEIYRYNPATSKFDGDAIDPDNEVEENRKYYFYKFDHPSNRVSFCNMSGGVVITNGIDDLVFFEYDRKKILSGTVEGEAGSSTITGTNTHFEDELRVGDKVEISWGEGTLTSTYSYFVIEVNNTHLIIEGTIEVTIPSDSKIYLSNISRCNATLVDSEDHDYSVPVRGLAINFYAGRLWIGGDNGLFYSGTNEYWGWDKTSNDAGVIQDSYGDTSTIRALGLYSQYMLVHREYYTYLLECSGPKDTIKVTPYSNISCDSQQSFCNANTKYYVYSQELMDIYPLMQRSIFQDKYLGESITMKVRNKFHDLNSSALDKVFCVTQPKKRYMAFYMPMVDREGSGYALVYSFQTKSFLVRELPKSQVVTIAFNYNNNIYVGTKDGRVLKEFSGYDFNGEPIVAYFKTPWFDWSDGYTQSFSEFSIQVDGASNNNFHIEAYKDGDIRTERRTLDSDKLTGTALIWDGIVGQDLPDNNTVWAYPENDTEHEGIGNIWVDNTISEIRIVLPNNVFGNFQLKIFIDSKEQWFDIINFAFRRIETDEAPW